MTEPTPSTSSAPPLLSLGRRRLALIGGVLAVAAVAGLALGVVLSGNRGGGSLGGSAAYVPADAVMYVEARLDLPGDQRARLRAILDRFPAVNADDILTDALARTLDELLADAGAPVDYSTDVAPWFTGRVALAMLGYPADPTAMRMPSVLAMLGVRDRDAAVAVADAVRAELGPEGATFTSSQHAGFTIWSLEVATEGMAVPMGGGGLAYAATDDQLLLANDAASIATALDVHRGGTSLSGRNDVGSLVAGLPAEPAGIAVLNTKAMLDEMVATLQSTAPEVAGVVSAYLEGLPPISVGTLSFASDAVVLHGASDVPTGAFAAANGRRDLAGRVPADAVLFADAADLGPMLRESITAVKAAVAAGPEGERSLAQLEQVESALGGDLQELVAWIGDGAFAAGWDGTHPWGGLVIHADDADAARQRLDQLRAIVQLAQLGGSGDVTVTSEDVDGVEVTTIRAATAGLDAELPVAAVIVEYALDGDTALIGFGDAFVRQALALDGGDGSLAGSGRFSRATERVGGLDNSTTLWVDIAALRDAVLAASGEDLPPDVSANLAPLDYLVAVSRVDGGRLRSEAALVLR